MGVYPPKMRQRLEEDDMVERLQGEGFFSRFVGGSIRKPLTFLLGFVLLLGSLGLASAEPSLHVKAGEWKIEAVMTMKSSAPGMPTMPARHSSLLDCLSSHHLVPDQKAKMPKDCTFTKHFSGNTLTSTLRCGQSVTTGRYTYSGRSFRGQSVTTMTGNLPMTMETRFTGHYVGPCRHPGKG